MTSASSQDFYSASFFLDNFSNAFLGFAVFVFFIEDLFTAFFASFFTLFTYRDLLPSFLVFCYFSLIIISYTN